MLAHAGRLGQAGTVWEGNSKRQLVVIHKTVQTARAANAAGAIPHHFGVPILALRHGEQALTSGVRRGVKRVVIRPQRRLHVKRKLEAGGGFQRVLRRQNHAVVGDGAGPHALGAQAWRDGPEAGLADEIQHIDQHRALHNFAVHHLVELTIAQVNHLVGGGNAVPVASEAADPVADHANVAASIISAGHDDGVAPFQIGERLQKRTPHGALNGFNAPHLIHGVRAAPMRIGVVDVREVPGKGAGAGFGDGVHGREDSGFVGQEGVVGNHGVGMS